MGSFKPSNPGTCIAISPLNVLSLSEPQALQVIRVELCLARWDRKGQKLPVYLISFVRFRQEIPKILRLD